jgi:pantetheine-phosphate adenylyltransferase
MAKMIHAVYPGSFDPITNGHLDIIQRGIKIFDRLTVAVLINPAKNPLFTYQERITMITEAIRPLAPAAGVDRFEGLLIEYARRIKANVILRGLRAVSDFEFEFQLSLMNQRLNSCINTVYLMSGIDFTYLSSGLVREISALGGNVAGLVPPGVCEKLQEKNRALRGEFK